MEKLNYYLLRCKQSSENSSSPDSFKGSLTALEVSDAIIKGIREVFPEAEIIKIPMADGGDGTVECLVNATGGEILREKVIGRLTTI